MIKLITIVLAIVFLSYSPTASIAQAPVRGINEYTTQELVAHFASQYQVSEKQMLATIRCESSFNEKAVGDGGKSFGLSQIHLPSHPTVTKEQATNKVFAVEFMAKAFAKKQQRMWTCWRNIYLG